MSAAFGRYAPVEKRFGNWAFRTIYHPTTRRAVAEMVHDIRHAHGNSEANEFLNYLHWLGTYPVVGAGRWVNKYGR